jgi:lysophospholipase L1-like esterase
MKPIISYSKAKQLETKLKNTVKDLTQLANNVLMRNGIDTTTLILDSTNTVEFTTNSTFGNVGFAVPNTNGNRYVCISIVKNIGTVNSPITKRQIAYNNSPTVTSPVLTNGAQVGTSIALNAGQSVTFVDKFTSSSSSNTAIMLGISSATSGVKLKVTQKIYDVTALDDDIVNLQIKGMNADYAETANIAYSLESGYQNFLTDYSLNYINCWGDSLTRGVGTSADTKAYPSVLGTLTGKTVYNMGIPGENSSQIALRQGGLPVWVNNITIPAGTTPVQIGTYANSGLKDIFGNNQTTLLSGSGLNQSINPCTIAGVQGTLAWTGANATDVNGTFTFTRTTAGNAVTINRPTLLTTYAMQNYRDNISVFWVGTNDKPSGSNVQDLVINKIKSMKDYLRTKKYIVIGMTALSYMPDIVNVNIALAKEFGFRFLDIRTYLLNYGLSDAGITPTAQDNTDIVNGEIPTSLRASGDAVHLNDAGYNIVANQVYQKLKDLGYVS